MAGNFEYYAEMGLNAGAAISELSRVSATAETTTKNLDALEKALDSVGKGKDSRSPAQVKQLQDTLGLYQQLATAVGSYGRSLKTINSTDLNNGVRKTATSLDHMKKALEGVGKTSKEDFDAKKRTLDLYKQMAGASKTQADTLRSEADAIKAVAQAERTRQQTARSAATPSGGGGTDAWGVTTDERQQRQRAQVVVQAEREMEAAFESRAREQLKANGQMDRQQAAVHEAAAANRQLTDDTKKGTDAQAKFGGALASSRYALYEIAAAYTAVSAAALAMPVASAKAAIEMEAQFAHVARTTQAADAPLENLRQRFMDLSTEIPVTYEELAKIGTLGAQMGIATKDLESFADTVAKFSATTNVSVEEASTYFGRLANMMDDVDESSYRNLGAAVSELGTASVSTEKEILAVAESIATTANMAGFSADEVVGLSTAMASLRIRPEMARGAMQRIFAKINQAVGEGSEVLDEYANLLGVTADQAGALWRNDPSQFFMRVNEQLSAMDDNVARSIYMREQLQITNIRDVELLARLSNGYDTYASSMDLAYDAYERGNYLEKEAGVIFETTAASLTKLSNAFKAMLDSFGQASLGPVKVVADLMTFLMNTVRGMSPAFKSGAVGLASFIGIFAAVRAALALTTASLLAFQLIQKQLAPEGRVSFGTLRAQAAATFPGMKAQIDAVSASLTAFRANLAAAPGVMGKTAVAARGLGAAIASIGWAGWIGIAVTATAALWGFASAHESAAQKARDSADAFIESGGGIQSLLDALRKDAEELASGKQTEVYGHLTIGIEETEAAAVSAASALEGTLIPAHEEQAKQVRDTNEAYLEGIGAIGEYTDAWMRAGLAEKISEVLTGEEVLALNDMGFDWEELLRTWQAEGQSGAVAYAETFSDEYARHFAEHDYAGDMGAAIEGAAIRVGSIAAGKISEQFVDLDSGLEAINSRMLLNKSLGLDAFDGIGDGAEGAAAEVEKLGEEFNSLVEGMFDFVNAEAAVYAAMQSLGEAIDENGTSFDVATEAGRANMAAFQTLVESMAAEMKQAVESGAMTADEAANQFANDYTALLDSLAAQGVDTSEFDYFRDHIDALFADPVVVGVDTTPAIQELIDLSNLASDILGNIAANSGGLLGGVASWGQGVANNYANNYKSTIGTSGRAQRAGAIRQQADTNAQRAARLQHVEAARAAAEQERLAKAAEDAAKETKKQADEQKKAADEAKKLREEIADAKDEGRIFEEIIKGLGEAFKDTLYQFNNFQSNRDSVESHLISMRDAAQQSAEQVRSLREEHRKLRQEASEDRVEARQAESFAAVARRYGDTERVVDYTTQAKGARASAAEKDRLAREALKEADALNKNRLALTGYSEEAINNRGQVRALQERMADLILAYAETGATTEEVTRYAENLRRKFVDQLTQMGYNRRDAERLSQVFVQLKTDIDRIPRQVRIEARARVKEAEAALRNVARGRTATIDIKPKQNRMEIAGNLKVRDIEVAKEITVPSIIARTNNFEYGSGATSNWRRAGGGLIPGPSNPRGRDNMLVVGPNGPEGTVGSGEFVIRKPAVDAIGLNTLHALNSMSPGAVAMSSAPAVNASRGIQLVELLPHQVHQLAQAVSTVLAVDGKVLAGTTNAQNTNAARRGVR